MAVTIIKRGPPGRPMAKIVPGAMTPIKSKQEVRVCAFCHKFYLEPCQEPTHGNCPNYQHQQKESTHA